MSRLPKLVGRQQEIIYLRDRGHIVVLGTAGSGKTSMAISRAIELQKNHVVANQRTLLVTFNKQLVEYLKALVDELPQGLVVENVHKTARGYLYYRGLMRQNAIAGPDKRAQFIARAVIDIRSNANHPILQRSEGFFMEEIKWITEFGVRTLEDYIARERVSRKGTRVERSSRSAVWQVYQRYLQIREANGYWYDFHDVAMTFETAISKEPTGWQYRHVVIDEAQDLSPAMLRALARAVPTDGSLTFFGDVAQQIYGTRVTWKDAGLSTQRVFRFAENYRNTTAIAALAIALASTPYFAEESDIVMPSRTMADGPLPALVRLSSIDMEETFITHQALSYGRTQSVAVLVKSRQQVRALLTKLKGKSTSVRSEELHAERGRWFWGAGIQVGTYQAAKGLEFDAVLMPYCSTTEWPDPEKVADVGEDEACAENARMLYVGITRARTRLVISFCDEVTKLLPNDTKLYNYQEF